MIVSNGEIMAHCGHLRSDCKIDVLTNALKN